MKERMAFGPCRTIKVIYVNMRKCIYASQRAPGSHEYVGANIHIRITCKYRISKDNVVVVQWGDNNLFTLDRHIIVRYTP